MNISQRLERETARHVEDSKPAELADAYAALSARYDEGAVDPRSGRYVPTRIAALAYLAARAPATFAAARAALMQASLHQEDVSSVLDLGGGPGVATLAAIDVWPGIKRALQLEDDEQMVRLSKSLVPAVADGVNVSSVKADFTDRRNMEEADLVIASYSLGELAEPQRARAVLDAWSHARGLLVIVEPGTTKGFSVVRQAREVALSAGGTVAAPCPHDEACPMANPDWCHFGLRVSRSSIHRTTKGGVAPFELEHYSYVAIARAQVHARTNRVISHPNRSKSGILFRLCTPAGLTAESISKRDSEAHRRVRRLAWGDQYPLDPSG